MNLKLIDMAIKGYAPHLDQGDRARLDLFRALWDVMDQDAAKAPSYEAPAPEMAQTAVRMGESVFGSCPVAVDGALLAQTTEKLLAVLLEKGQFPASTCASLAAVNWEGIMPSLDMKQAGSNPWAFLDSAAELLVKSNLSQADARLAVTMLFLALRVQLEPAAVMAVQAVGQVEMEQGHFLKCPICDSDPMVARVGGENATEGRGKVLGCLQCGSSWDFERIRCARCGTVHQGHLHYFNLEGDDAHRLNTCDECGGYMRTVFVEQSLAPFSFEVEDVLMAKLDAVAANPSMAKGQE